MINETWDRAKAMKVKEYQFKDFITEKTEEILFKNKKYTTLQAQYDKARRLYSNAYQYFDTNGFRGMQTRTEMDIMQIRKEVEEYPAKKEELETLISKKLFGKGKLREELNILTRDYDANVVRLKYIDDYEKYMTGIGFSSVEAIADKIKKIEKLAVGKVLQENFDNPLIIEFASKAILEGGSKIRAWEGFSGVAKEIISQSASKVDITTKNEALKTGVGLIKSQIASENFEEDENSI